MMSMNIDRLAEAALRKDGCVKDDMRIEELARR
jgi:hypothetical protein